MANLLPEPRDEGFSFERRVPRTAGLGSRFLALVLDFLVVALLAWGLAFGMTVVGFHPDLEGVGTEGILLGVAWLTLILELPINLVYFTVLEGWRGATLGKAVVGLEVVQVDGARLGFLDAFVRTLLRLLWVTPALGQVFLLADAVMVRRSEMEQRIGDMAADSVVAEAGSGPKR